MPAATATCSAGGGGRPAEVAGGRQGHHLGDSPEAPGTQGSGGRRGGPAAGRRRLPAGGPRD